MQSPPLEDRWNQDASGTHYAGRRFANERRAGHDPKMVSNLLKRFGEPRTIRSLLDVPCGTGRLHPILSRFTESPIGLDVAPSMLAEHIGRRRVQGSAFALPFADHSLDVVVCCRLFHHLRSPEQRCALIRELLRVSAGPVLMSFWDSASWHAWRRRIGLRKTRNQDRRVAVSKADLRKWVAAEGGELLGFEHSLRGISQQAFVAMRHNT